MRQDGNEYPNGYWDKQEQQREEQTESEGKKQEEKPSRAPVIIILSAIALLLILLIVALGAAANQFTQWAQDLWQPPVPSPLLPPDLLLPFPPGAVRPRLRGPFLPHWHR